MPAKMARSKRYYCSTPKCTNSIEVVGPAKDDYAALTRVDWKVRSLSTGDVACRRHDLLEA